MNLTSSDHIALLSRDPRTRLLAFDLGNKTGWAIHHGDGRPDDSGSWVVWDSARGSRPVSALEDFAWRVNELINGCSAQVICYEQISVGHGKRSNFMAAASLRELLTTLKLVANNRGIPMKGFNLASIKAFAVNGRAKKPAMIAAYKRHYGVQILDHNECDAAWVAKYFLRPDIWMEKEAEAAQRKGKAKKKPRKLDPQRRFC